MYESKDPCHDSAMSADLAAVVAEKSCTFSLPLKGVTWGSLERCSMSLDRCNMG